MLVMHDSFIDKLAKDEQFYHKMATALSKRQTKVKNGYDVLHDSIVESLETGDDWKTCRARINRKIDNKDVRDNNDEYINRHYVKANIGRRLYPTFNMNACKFFDVVNDILHWSGYPIGYHATNGGEKKILRFYLDFYIPEYCIVIEYNEKQHYWSKKYRDYDKWRRYEIERITNMPMIIVHEDKETPEEIAKSVIRHIEYSVEKKTYNMIAKHTSIFLK